MTKSLRSNHFPRLDSVSVHSAEHINYPVALIDGDNVEPAPKEPDVSYSYNSPFLLHVAFRI